MSRFLQDTSHEEKISHRDIDFDDIIRLPAGGSICDIYRTKWHRRDVFVKRLKEEFRSNPLYLDALEKEYDVGSGLRHPSLPYYHEYHRDYIVMEYIDGETLAKMIKNRDPWLNHEKNVLRILRGLVEVIDYLHRHNVTHCDIKADNIMITANNHNLVLIDFDKCYTDSFNETSGDPLKYGLTEKDQGRISIDFHGMAQLIEKMANQIPGFRFSKYAAFIKECNKKEPSTEELLNILDYKPGKPSRKLYWMITLAPFCVALLFGFVLLLTQGKGGYEKNLGVDEPSTQGVSTPYIEPDKELREEEGDENNIQKENNREFLNSNPIPLPVSQEESFSKAREMASQLDIRIKPYFDELNTLLENLVKQQSKPDITGVQLLTLIRNYTDQEEDYYQEAYEILKEMYPGITDREAWRVLSYSKVYTDYNHKSVSILNGLRAKVEEMTTQNEIDSLP